MYGQLEHCYRVTEILEMQSYSFACLHSACFQHLPREELL